MVPMRAQKRKELPMDCRLHPVQSFVAHATKVCHDRFMVWVRQCEVVEASQGVDIRLLYCNF